MDADKLKALDGIYKNIGKEYGKSIVIDAKKEQHIPRYQIESPSLRYTMCGGLPKGRIIEFFGPPSGGKSSISTIMAGNIQKFHDAYVVYLDIEHAFDYDYAKILGINTSMEQFQVIEPDWGEQAMNILQKLVESQAVDIIIIDSVAALVPKVELDGEMGKQHMALQARLMSQAMRKLTAIVKKSGTTLLFINQTRMKIGVTFGSPVTTTGGEALKFYSSIRQNISRIGYIKDPPENGEVVASRIRIKCGKNKTGPPMREIEFDLYYDRGIYITGEYLDFGITYGFVDKAGTWYSIDDNRLGQGKKKAIATLNGSGFKEILAQLKKDVDSILFPSYTEEDVSSVDDIEQGDIDIVGANVDEIIVVENAKVKTGDGVVRKVKKKREVKKVRQIKK